MSPVRRRSPALAFAVLLAGGSAPAVRAYNRTATGGASGTANSTVYNGGNGGSGVVGQVLDSQSGGHSANDGTSVANTVDFHNPAATAVQSTQRQALTVQEQAAAMLADRDVTGAVLTPQGDLIQGSLQQFLDDHGMRERSPDGSGYRMNDLGWALFTGLVQKGKSIREQALSGAVQPALTAVQPPTDRPELTPAASVTAAQVVTAVAPADPRGWTLLGDGLAGTGKPDKAVAEYTKAIDLGAPPPVRYKRGLAAERAGDHELANADALAVLKASPGDAEAHSLYMLTRGRSSSVHLIDGAQAAAGLGQEGAAGQAVSGAAGTLGNDTVPGATADQIAAAENAAMSSRSVSTQSARLLQEAKGALQVGDAPKALALAEQALKADPNNAEAYYVRANAYLRLGDSAAAARELSAGLALAPGNGPLLYTRAIANGRQKLWQEAYKDADQAVRSAPRKGYGYQARAGVNWGLGQRDAMMADLKTAAALDPKYAADLRRATQVPADVDPTLLFGDANAAAAQMGGVSKPGHGPRTLLWLAGAGLAAAGLLPFLFPGVRKRATTILRRGPAAADEEAAPASGFWRRYEVTREIGAGGMGVVYEAKDLGLERRVAVKRMRDEIRGDRRERERFLQEARTVAKLRHPNLVEIYSIEEDGDDAYLVFEYVDGRTLQDILEEKGRLSPAQARELFRGVCAGVDYAHRKGFVHRDLKPSNIMVQSDGTVKVMDFGVARQAQDALARRQLTNTVIGTPQYMAPEQENGVVCAQSDVYALGVCLYEALTGAPPFAGTAGAVTLAKLEARYEPLPQRVSGLPSGLARLIERSLDPKPETRIQSAAEFQKELDAAVAGAAVS